MSSSACLRFLPFNIPDSISTLCPNPDLIRLHTAEPRMECLAQINHDSDPCQQTPTPPQFSSLPAEIRNTIYNHLSYRSDPSITINHSVFGAPTGPPRSSSPPGPKKPVRSSTADNLLALISLDVTHTPTVHARLLKSVPPR